MKRFYSALLLLILGAGCTSLPLSGGDGLSPIPVTGIVEATPEPESLPDPQIIVRAYLDAWKNGDHQNMYAWLSTLSQDAIESDDFQAIYRDVAAALTLNQIDYEILSSLTQSRSAQVAYRIELQTRLVGVIQRDTVMNLSLEEGQWRVQWDHALILPELSGGNTLWMEPQNPGRGNIYDLHGRALVAQSEAVSLGLVKGETDPEQEEWLLSVLWDLTGLPPSYIRDKLNAYREGWYVPLAEVSAERVEARFEILSSFEGLVMETFHGRYYFNSGVASQAIGYVSAIQPGEVEDYIQQGYQQDDRVGRMGLERWSETQLAGTHGGKLYVVSPEGQIITKLAESDPEPSNALYTTLDKELQIQVQKALEGFLGAVVVLERDTGRVLAMASSPGFDPNLFEPTNYNSSYLLQDLLEDPDRPFLNRATQGQYPLGSVFKIITLAAALESGRYTADSTYFCGHTFNEVEGTTRYDWTYSYGAPPSGLLTLPEGLMRSCNPWFWHIGLDFFTEGLDTLVSDMGRGFGLGQPTGIQEIVEETGQIPVPQNQVDAINFAIGQGETLVTPLQVARFIAAVGNGGNLLRPQFIERFESPGGESTSVFSPEVVDTLPLSDENLKIIQDALVSVVANPRGTAYWQFINFQVPIAGKTGTAETPFGDPHAWFAGYTYGDQQDRPNIAAAVILENAGEGSVMAAPVFKRILEIYYFDTAITPLPWETASDLPPPPPDSGTP